MSEKIIKNQARCPKCQQIIESTTLKRRVTCKCGYLTIDGGLDQLLREGEHDEMSQFYFAD